MVKKTAICDVYKVYILDLYIDLLIADALATLSVAEKFFIEKYHFVIKKG
ncbi:hypothetical protein [Tepidibacter thalassicus]|nr:hypothetical protein [Tepidibacter thalassicus]